jgi:hypothetical protein
MTDPKPLPPPRYRYLAYNPDENEGAVIGWFFTGTPLPAHLHVRTSVERANEDIRDLWASKHLRYGWKTLAVPTLDGRAKALPGAELLGKRGKWEHHPRVAPGRRGPLELQRVEGNRKRGYSNSEMTLARWPASGPVWTWTAEQEAEMVAAAGRLSDSWSTLEHPVSWRPDDRVHEALALVEGKSQDEVDALVLSIKKEALEVRKRFVTYSPVAPVIATAALHKYGGYWAFYLQDAGSVARWYAARGLPFVPVIVRKA